MTRPGPFDHFFQSGYWTHFKDSLLKPESRVQTLAQRQLKTSDLQTHYPDGSRLPLNAAVCSYLASWVTGSLGRYDDARKSCAQNPLTGLFPPNLCSAAGAKGNSVSVLPLKITRTPPAMVFWGRRPSRSVHAAGRSTQGRPPAGKAVLSSLLEAEYCRFQDGSLKARKSESGTHLCMSRKCTCSHHTASLVFPPSLPSVARTGWEMTRITARWEAGENIYLAWTRSP